MKYHSQLTIWDLRNARVVVRADLNVPISHDAIMSDLKLKALQPTLDYLISQGCIITLLTHLGNPNHPDPALSTRVLLPWFENQHYTTVFSETVAGIPCIIEEVSEGTIILCENIRFFKGEKEEDINFAHELKQCGDFYINDGFACMHRKETSITLLPKLFVPEKKSIGFYTQQELHSLDTFIANIKKTCVCIIGGKKISSKLPFLFELLNKVDTLIICPAIAFTILKSEHISVGKSLVDDGLISSCQDLLIKAKEKNVRIIFPDDLVVSRDNFEPPYQIVSTNAIPNDATGISIGPRTNAFLEHILSDAHTIIYNGAMGFLEKPASLDGMYQLLQTIARSNAASLIAGGDSAASAYYLGMQHSFTHISLGGGATLFYLIHKTLPALQALSK